ncbi:hypothetical protein F4677DRAFT_459111, partial [Hypoxylon crocopeplum]
LTLQKFLHLKTINHIYHQRYYSSTEYPTLLFPDSFDLSITMDRSTNNFYTRRAPEMGARENFIKKDDDEQHIKMEDIAPISVAGLGRHSARQAFLAARGMSIASTNVQPSDSKRIKKEEESTERKPVSLESRYPEYSDHKASIAIKREEGYDNNTIKRARPIRRRPGLYPATSDDDSDGLNSQRNNRLGAKEVGKLQAYTSDASRYQPADSDSWDDDEPSMPKKKVKHY